jgi:hypothetical protein
MRLPSRCPHVNFMIFDDDYCCCSLCEQEWALTKNGWKPLVGGDVYEKRNFKPKRKPKKGFRK